MAARVVLLAAVVSLLSACAITGNFRNDPGYAAFGAPGFVATNREFAMSLGPLPLRVACWFLHDEPDVVPLLKELRAVRIYTYDAAGDAERVARHVSNLQAA